MIDFKERKSWGVSGSEEQRKAELEKLTELVKIALGCLDNKRFALGVQLNKLYKSRAYSVEAYKYEPGLRLPYSVGNCASEYFFAYCADKFGLDKSQVSRYMNIVDEYGTKPIDDTCKCAVRWREYGYSQLVEMLPLTKEQRENVKPDWTIKRIREYKLSLVAMSQRDENAKKQQVATSQQELEKQKVGDDQSFISERYKRFFGKSSLELCDEIIQIELERDELKSENARLEEWHSLCVERYPDLALLKVE